VRPLTSFSPFRPPAPPTAPPPSLPAVARPSAPPRPTNQQGLTPEELDELEAAEEWVAAQAMCEELERQHLILLALEYAPEAVVEQIEQRASTGNRRE